MRECKDGYRPSEEDETRVEEGVIRKELRVKPYGGKERNLDKLGAEGQELCEMRKWYRKVN